MEQNENPLDAPDYLIKAWESRKVEDKIKLLTEWREKELNKNFGSRIDFLLTTEEIQGYSNSSFDSLPRHIQIAFRATVDAEFGYTPPYESKH